MMGRAVKLLDTVSVYWQCVSELKIWVAVSDSSLKQEKACVSVHGCQSSRSQRMNEKKISVLLVDDHQVVRAGFRMLLDSQSFIGNIVDVDRGELACHEYDRQRPDVVVMDLSMPGIGGLETIRRLKKQDPQAVILVYSIHDESIYVERAIQAGAKGYVTKN